MPITTQCQLLGLSRSSAYYRPRGVSEADLRLMRRLDELHLEHPFLGARARQAAQGRGLCSGTPTCEHAHAAHGD